MMSEPPFEPHRLHDEALADVRRVVRAVERHTGLTSRWNGSLRVRGLEFSFAGQKHRLCSISIHENVLLKPAQRWPTMIHEALHSVSGAMLSGGPVDPWEEAIAEQTQRLLRPTILTELGIQVDADELDARDLAHAYNASIDRLDVLRRVLRRETAEFFLTLLAASATERTVVRIDAQRRLRQDGGDRP
jgi:hypothetical protein